MSPQHAIVRFERPTHERAPLELAEARLSTLLDELAGAEAALDALGAKLAVFEAHYQGTVGDAHERLAAAEGLLRRVRALGVLLQEAQRRLTAPRGRGRKSRAPPALPYRRPAGALPGHASDPRPAAHRDAHAQRAHPKGVADDAGRGGREAGREVGEDTWGAGADGEPMDLKKIYRALARALHPDLARDERERGRLGELMAQVNAAYARRDRGFLELFLAKVGRGRLEGLGEGEQLHHLEGRIRTLEAAAAQVRHEHERLARCATHRLFEAHEQAAREGRDFLMETRDELEEDTSAALDDASARLTEVEAATEAFVVAARGRRRDLTRFDPLLESGLVRAAARRLEQKRAGPGARALARTLEARALDAPWEVRLTLMAFFAEAARRPPDSLATHVGWRGVYEALTVEPEAPSFLEALARLPRHLMVGMTRSREELQVGIRLGDADAVPGVPLALEHPHVAALAAEVLASLGPVEPCPGCGHEGPLLHLLRTHGLDERHGMVCAACGRAVKSYFFFSKPEGLEALADFSRRLGIVVEQPVLLAGRAVAFQLLAAERDALTAGALLERFTELYLTPNAPELEPTRLRLTLDGVALGPAEVIPEGALPELELTGGADSLTSLALLEQLRLRIARRFSPNP